MHKYKDSISLWFHIEGYKAEDFDNLNFEQEQEKAKEYVRANHGDLADLGVYVDFKRGNYSCSGLAVPFVSFNLSIGSWNLNKALPFIGSKEC